jgi:hypothetical protein
MPPIVKAQLFSTQLTNTPVHQALNSIKLVLKYILNRELISLLNQYR